MALSGTQKIAIGLVTLGVLGFLVKRQMDKDKHLGSEKAEVDLPKLEAPKEADKFVITNADKGEVVLEKKGSAWRMTKPVDAPASDANVKSMLDNLKELELDEIIAPKSDPELKKLYELDDAHAVHVVAFKGGEKKFDATFGKSGTRGQIGMIAGHEPIYLVKGYSSYLYARETKQWRDQEIFKFDDEKVVSVSLDIGGKKLVFKKDDKAWSGTANGAKIARFDGEKLKDAVRVMKSLQAENFGDGKSLEDAGLDKPEAEVEITLKDNGGTYKLAVGKKAEGESRYAKKDGNDTIFVISSYAAEWLTTGVEKFQKALDGGASPSAAAPPMGGPGGDMPMMPSMPPGHP